MSAAAAKQLARIYDIYDPWIAATADREHCVVTLNGRPVDLYIPLGAAVEIEEAGYDIKVY